MNTPVSSLPTLAMEFPSRPDPLSSPRLLVLVPAEADYSATTRRLWDLATAVNADILLLGLCKDAAQEPALRRELVTMASLLRDGRVSADLKVEIGTNWVEAVKRNRQACDLIVCFAEQRAGLLQRPLSQILQSNVDSTVYILSGLSSQTRPDPDWRFSMVTWVGSIAIIVLAFLLQIRITLLPQDWIQTTLLILSVLGEVWLIGAWNSLFG
jgi:hypothetical protein